MRIGIDAHAAERDGTGNCTYTRNLILELLKCDSEDRFVLFVMDPAHPFYSTIATHSNVEIVSLGKIPAWLRVFFFLPIAARRKKLDLLQVQYFAPFGAGSFVDVIHDVSWMHAPEHFSRFERLLFRVLVPSSAKRAKMILTCSATSKKDLVAMGVPQEKVKVIHDGIMPVFASDDMHTERISEVCLRYGLDRKFLLYVGRIDPRKNLVRLIHAFSYLRKRYGSDHQLAIVGKVHLQPRELQQTLNASEYREDIRICGFVPDEDLPALYHAADVFAYVSENEGFGFPPLEAMLSGTPVVASDVPIFHEILGDAALLVNPYDVAAIADGIHRVIADQNYRDELIEKGLNRSKQFTWENTARLTLQAYHEAFKQPS